MYFKGIFLWVKTVDLALVFTVLYCIFWVDIFMYKIILILGKISSGPV